MIVGGVNATRNCAVGFPPLANNRKTSRDDSVKLWKSFLTE